MEFENDIVESLEVLHRGGIILYPTDTIWGLGCDATNATAVQRIYDLKQRPSSKSMIVLLADLRDLNRYISNPQPAVGEYLVSQSQPTTVIFDGALGFAQNLIADDGSIAIRVVREDFCRHLIKRFRKPIVSTSANISGHPAPENFHHIKDDIMLGVDYVVRYRQDDQKPSTASRVVRFDRQGNLLVVRE